MATDLRLVAVGDIKQTFVVPAYQRGYRWGPGEVSALLDDIAAIKSSDDRDYCLQPIVVKKMGGTHVELVDGQQRMTTLYLLLLFMKQKGFKKSGPPFSISYETRPDSGAFLRELDTSRKEENIDFFHMANAFECIEGWFAARGDHAEVIADEIYVHLFRRVKVIWYEAEADVPSAALFARLNVGRIPLTNAELIKALLLRGEPGAENRRAVEIGTQWDAVERRLRDPGLWAFVTNREPSGYPNRIELLFDSMVDTKGIDRLHTFHRFKQRVDEGAAGETMWQEALARMELFEEWYEDRDLYHWIGFLIATGLPSELRTLVGQAEEKTKTEFRKSLHARLVARLNLSRKAVDDLAYDGDPAACSRLLLLFNVESTRLLRHSLDRYPFHAHKGERWSLEHIHAQNATELRRKDQWQTWLREHLKALRELHAPDANERDALVGEIEEHLPDPSQETFVSLAARVVTLFEAADAEFDVHGVANLALLPRETNSALSNAVFEVKRQRVLELDREGNYLPICTRRVFLKYYTAAGDQQLQLWSRQDREAYFDAMFGVGGGVLTPYLEEGE